MDGCNTKKIQGWMVGCKENSENVLLMVRARSLCRILVLLHRVLEALISFV